MTGRRFSACIVPLIIVGVLVAIHGCTTEDSPLAPYVGSNQVLAPLTVQDSVFTPNVTWLGGYITAFGVNRGSRAMLDSSLVWLIVSPGNTLRYPTTYGTIPAGAAEISSTYGGTPLTRLREDFIYTFWIMKQDAWSQVSGLNGKRLLIDSAATAQVTVRNDSVLIGQLSFTLFARMLDVYINIKDFKSYGRLGPITVTASDTCNRPNIVFKVTQSGVTDTAISAIGVCLGGQYQVNNREWEVISADVRPDTTIYWKNNVIRSPLQMGQAIPGTQAFVSYPAEGLRRGVSYYIWIANKDWDQVGRTRSTPNYAFATFTVW